MFRPVCAVALLIAGTLLGLEAASPEGHLVLVGGGATPEIVFRRTLELSGGRAATIAVLPHTYPDDTIGDTAVAMWKQLGVRDVVKVRRDDPGGAPAALERATLIWIPGGFQGLFMKSIAGTPIPDLILSRFGAGATIGGASAGAAAMSLAMIADGGAPAVVGREGPATERGLGLWPEAIVSPHFTERRRMNALLMIMRDHPDLLGVGLDEGTAAIVSGGRLEVVGRGGVTIVDAREAKSNGRPAVHVFTAGMQWRY